MTTPDAGGPAFRDEVLGWTGTGLHDAWPLLEERRDQPEQNQEAFRAGGTRQRLRSADPHQSGYYDLPRYRELVARAVALAGGAQFAVDLGCGDGRGVLQLLAAGVPRVLGVDFNPAELRAVWDSLDAGQRQRTALACASVRSLGRFGRAADVVLALEVLSTLAEPDEAVAHAAAMLRPGGILLVSDPVAESLFVHALLNGDWNNVERLAREGIYTDAVAGRQIPLYLRSAARTAQLMAVHGLEPVETTDLPARHALLLHALRRHAALESQGHLLEALERAPIAIPRIRVSLYRRTGVAR